MGELKEEKATDAKEPPTYWADVFRNQGAREMALKLLVALQTEPVDVVIDNLRAETIRLKVEAEELSKKTYNV